MTEHEAPGILQTKPVVRELLRAPIMARLAYTWTNGTPRVVPMWFHWTGTEILMGAPPNAPKMTVLRDNAAVAISIDTDTWPYRVLTIRGTIHIDIVDELFPGTSGWPAATLATRVVSSSLQRPDRPSRRGRASGSRRDRHISSTSLPPSPSAWSAQTEGAADAPR